MGMFDDIRCEMPLPKVWPSQNFQTKSLDCEMDRYTITADGRLVQHVPQYDEIPVHERKANFLGIVHTHRVGGYKDKLIDHHGDIEFYDYSKSAGWIGFTARFTEGVCARIKFREWQGVHGEEHMRPPADAPPALARATQTNTGE
jgi:hypothetical protein